MLVIAVGVLAALVILSALPVLNNYQHSQIELLQAGQQESFNQHRQAAGRELKEVTRDVRLLTNLDLAPFFNAQPAQQERQVLRSFLAKVLSASQRYSELQLIYPDGREALHLYVGDEVTALAPTEQYNNISEAAYFKAGVGLAANTLQVHFDIATEATNSPAIRLLTPVTTADNTIGLLVLRLKVEGIFDGLWEKLPLLSVGYGAITNGNGDWVGHKGQLELGGQKVDNIQTASPALWQAMTAANEGLYDDGDNIYIFQRISVTEDANALISAEPQVFDGMSLSFDASATEFVIYTAYAKSDLLRLTEFNRATGSATFVAMIVLCLIIFYILLSYSRQARRYYYDRETTRKELADLYEDAPCGYFSISPDLTITKINNTLARWLETAPEDIVGIVKVSALLSTSDPQQVKKIFPALKANGSVNNLHLHLRGNGGKRIAVLANGIAINDKQGNMVEARCALYDYREIEAMQQRLESLSTTDPLTGLYQRRVFDEMAAKEFTRRSRTASALAVLLIEIDGFAHLLDTQGQDMADAALMHIAQLFFNAFRQADVIAKYSSERFAVLLPNTELEGAQIIANRVRELTQSRPVRLTSGDTIDITISIGLSSAKETDSTFGNVVKRARAALNMATDEGGNTLKTVLDDPS